MEGQGKKQIDTLADLKPKKKKNQERRNQMNMVTIFLMG